MLFLMIKKEIVHNILSFRFIVTYALLFCLILLALFLMTNDYGNRFQDYTSEIKKERERISELEKIEDPSKQFQEFQRSEFFGARSPKNMGILTRGVEGSLPVRISSRSYQFYGSSEDRLSKNMLFEIFPIPDFAFVINIIMSLLALLFVFDAICGEKEQGTLKLMMSHSVPRDIILIGKWIGGYLSIAIPFSVAVLGGFVYVYMSGSVEWGGDGMGRFLLIYAVSLLYISAFFTLGLMISTLTHRSATALLVSLMVWISWILVIPNLSPVVAGLLSPAPKRQAIEAEKRVIDEESRLLMETASKRQVVGREDYEKLQQEAEERKNKLEKFFQDKTHAQINLGKNLARLSPSACSLLAMTHLAGTGPVLFEQFHQALERYQEQHQSYMQGFYRSQKVEFTRDGPVMKEKDWFKPDDLPRFRMFEESLMESLDAALFDILLLLLYNVVFFMLSYLFFLRYDAT